MFIEMNSSSIRSNYLSSMPKKNVCSKSLDSTMSMKMKINLLEPRDATLEMIWDGCYKVLSSVNNTGHLLPC